MEVFTQQLINGITLGSIYGLIAIGYTMVFGIIGMVNFAHGVGFHRAGHLARAHDLGRRVRWCFGCLIVLSAVGHVVDLARQLDDRTVGLPAVARLVSTRAADIRDRHVEVSCRISCRSHRVKSIPPLFNDVVSDL